MNRLIILQVLLILAISLLLGISCGEAAPDLSAYRGIDYIQKYKLNSIVSGLTEGWISDDPTEGSYHYMGFTPVLHVPGINDAGLPDYAKEDMSRLEVFNLVNDGGFESGSLTGWSESGIVPVGALRPEVPTATHPEVTGATGKCLYYLFDTSNPAVITPTHAAFDLGTIKDSFLTGKKYIIRLKFFKSSQLSLSPLKFNNELPWNVRAQINWGFGYTKFPDAYDDNSEVVARSGSNYFFILYDTLNMEGFIDDFRIVRSDIDYYIKLTVPYSDAGRPNLQSGTYSFSAWFKAEDPADVSPSMNRFNSSRVSLGIGKTLNTTSFKGFDASARLSATSWTKLSVEKFVQIRNDGDSLILLISPSDKSGGNNTIDVGSVLVAYPELYYISE